ncbi:hypothetical protein MIR68_010856 [Amoeboaphelidium protococcarum]|nr:hypothetical protein MIR68_010856 [Amoeboaphelidium protococcarum]
MSKVSLAYELPLNEQGVGHRLGVNSIVSLDDLVYSGGKDGQIIRWSLEHNKSTNLSIQLQDAWQAHHYWINDLQLANQAQTLVSASSDATIKCWNLSDLRKSDIQYSTVLSGHVDFVKKLAVPFNQGHQLFSTGLDGRVIKWDLNVENGGAVDLVRGHLGTLESNYSLSTSWDGNIVCAGSFKGMVSIIDPRLEHAAHSLKAHGATVRSLLSSADGQTLISASSDKTVKIWSLRMMRCLQTISDFEDSVFELSSQSCHDNADSDLSQFYAGCRDGSMWHFKRRRDGSQEYIDHVVALNERPITALCWLPHRNYLVCGTDQPTVELWDSSVDLSGDDDLLIPAIEPIAQSQCQDGIHKQLMLDDRISVLTMSISGNIQLVNILHGQVVQQFEKMNNKDFEALYNRLNQSSDWCAQWCNVECVNGLLRVILNEVKAFDGELYESAIRKSSSSTADGQDMRVIVGKLVLSSLLKTFIDQKQMTQSSDGTAKLEGQEKKFFVKFLPDTNLMFQMDHNEACVPVQIFSCKLGNVKQNFQSLNKYLPNWIDTYIIKDVPIQKDIVKISFTVLPHSKSALPRLSQSKDKLVTNRMIQLAKIVDFIAEDLSQSHKTLYSNKDFKKSLIILLNDQILDHQLTLATIKYKRFSGSELILHYADQQELQ